MANFAPSAPELDPGEPDDLETDPKEIYRKLGREISTLSRDEKFQKVFGFLRRNANRVDINELALHLNYVGSRQLYRWMEEIRKSAYVQPLVPAVARGMGVGMMAPPFLQAVGQVSA
jgi:hypothetical protein